MTESAAGPVPTALGFRGPAPRWVRHLEIEILLERFLVSGASAFLIIRIYLALTNYPQVGGHGLHIAHMLWGGLGMLVAVVILLSFLGGHARAVAAIIGGAGFGTFVDELGKFITSDNNYFFQPTVAIIYVIFVLMFLAFQAISHQRASGERARIAQGLDVVVTALVAGYSPRQRELALAALDQSSDDPLARNVAVMLRGVEPLATHPDKWWQRLVSNIQAIYLAAIRSRRLFWIAVVVMGVQALVGLASVVLEVTLDPGYSPANLNLSLGDMIKIAASVAADVCIVVGLLQLRGNRSEALRWFKRAVLITIFVVQLFSFYDAGLGAAVSLAVNLTILAVLNIALAQEAAPHRDASSPSLAATRST